MFDRFDDSLLDDPHALAARDDLFRPLAESGARLRRAFLMAEPALANLDPSDRPRAIVACGPEARLMRAVLEPKCPVPFVAWPAPSLPAWVGALDVVVVIDPVGREPVTAVAEALRRGSRLIVVCPPDSAVADQSKSRSTTLLPVFTDDGLSAAILGLAAMQRLGVGPAVLIEPIAQGMDECALACATSRDSGVNPAKSLALEWADSTQLVWGYSVLAARASRRIVEAIRTATGKPALAADAAELLPLLDSSDQADVFADPFDARPSSKLSLIIVDGMNARGVGAGQDAQLTSIARVRGVRVSRIDAESDDDIVRYCVLLLNGLFAASYLKLGLGN